MVHRAAVEWMLLLTGAAALDCHADFWPEMHASPRRLEALILANGALVKLCFDADADGAVHRQHARAFLKAAGLVDVTVAGGLEDVLQRNDAVEAIVEVLFAAKQRRRSPAFSARVGFEDIDQMFVKAWPALRPDVAFDLVPLNRETKITARRGESAAKAAARSCAVVPYLHATADCEAEAAAEIIRLRGAHNAVPAGFGQMRIDLEEYLQERFSCPAGETCVALFEGGTYSYPFKLHAMRNLLGHVLRDRATAQHVEVCEVGFNAGHSTLLWLMADPRVRVRAFDLGVHWYSPHVTGFFDAAFDAGRVEVVFGDSQQTLPAFAAAFNSSSPPEFCDLIFVDGDHHFDAALSDLRKLRAAARPGHHVLLMDDPDHDEVGRAWRAMLADGVEHFGDVYEDAHGSSVYGARAAMVYGAYV